MKQIKHYPLNVDSMPLDLRVAIHTNMDGNDGTRMTESIYGPDGNPLPAEALVLLDSAGYPLTFTSAVSDAPYGPSWDGDGVTSPSKNAVFDKVEALAATIPPPLANGDKGDVVVSGNGAGMVVESAAGNFVATGKISGAGVNANRAGTVSSVNRNPGLSLYDYNGVAAYGVEYGHNGTLGATRIYTNFSEAVIIGGVPVNATLQSQFIDWATFTSAGLALPAGKTITIGGVALGGLADGDRGDVVISGSGSTLTVESASGTAFTVSPTASGNGSVIINPSGSGLYSLLSMNGASGLHITAGNATAYLNADTFTFRNAASTVRATLDATGFNIPTGATYKINGVPISGGGGAVSDAAYGVSWDGDTTTAPSKNAVYDKIQTLTASGSPLTDGDKGDVVVGAGGSTFTVESATPAGGTFNVTGAAVISGNLTTKSVLAFQDGVTTAGVIYANGVFLTHKSDYYYWANQAAAVMMSLRGDTGLTVTGDVTASGQVKAGGGAGLGYTGGTNTATLFSWNGSVVGPVEIQSTSTNIKCGASGSTLVGKFSTTGLDVSGKINANQPSVSSTTDRNPGVTVFSTAGFGQYGIELGYASGNFTTRLFTSWGKTVTIGCLGVDGTLQSDFVDWATFSTTGLAVAGSIKTTAGQLNTGGYLSRWENSGGSADPAAAGIGFEIMGNQAGVSLLMSYNRTTSTYASIHIAAADTHIRGTSHAFKDTTGATTFATIDSTGINIPPGAAYKIGGVAIGGGGGGLTDGDMGDVVVSGTGTVLTVESATPATGNFTIRNDTYTMRNAAQTAIFQTVLGDTPRTMQYYTDAFIVYDKAASGARFSIQPSGVLSNVALAVPDDAYAVGWNGSANVPTKNAVYDKIEAVAATIPSYTPRLQVAASNTVTPTFADDLVTRMAATGTITMNTPTGTAIDGHGIVVRLRGASAYTISWLAAYRAIGVTLPTALVANKLLILGLIYNATDTKWDVVSVAQEA